MARPPCIHPAFLEFLGELRRHNEREWFLMNKARYEATVRDPFLRLIEVLRPRLAAFRPAFTADPRPTGGSMMRIYRDTRFSRDKKPYKTAVAAHFPVAAGHGEARPGFYLHIEPGGSMLGGGLWRPDPTIVSRIRDGIVAKPAAWKSATTARSFTSALELSGESLKRMPLGYDAAHRFANDLKRKDFIFSAPLTDADVLSKRLPALLADRYARALPMMRFLINATTAAH